MIHRGKRSVLGVKVDVIDYEAAVDEILAAAKAKKGFSVSALAVHGVMTGVDDPEHLYRLNRFDLIVPDGQPVRWALNRLHRAGLKDRVYGPTLTLKLCERAAREKMAVYLYGSKPDVLATFRTNLIERFPGLRVAGAEPSKFKPLSEREDAEVNARIVSSGADFAFVGLGCPRQEVWAYEHRDALSMPVLAVGAAFDFHAGTLRQAPPWMQKRGLEWFFRFCMEPKRLFKRYFVLSPRYVFLAFLQTLGRRFDETGRSPARALRFG